MFAGSYMKNLFFMLGRAPVALRSAPDADVSQPSVSGAFSFPKDGEYTPRYDIRMLQQLIFHSEIIAFSSVI